MKKIILLNSKNIKKKHKNNHPLYEFDKQEITPRKDFDQLYAAFYEVAPNKSTFPFHYHEKNTELFYIIKGCGLLISNNDQAVINEGDVIVCPPGIDGAHKITNTSHNEVLRYLDVSTINSPETVYYPDSNKVGIIKHNESSIFYLDGKQTDYYEGE